MKKRFVACVFVIVMALSFAVPVLAADAAVAEPLNLVLEQENVEVTPFNEMTQIYFRWHNGNLQFRVWSITNGRWITDWLYV